MRNVKHQEDGAWVITNEDNTSKVEFYKDEAGISIYTRRTIPLFGGGEQVVARSVILYKEETELLKQFLLTPEDQTNGG